jgi:hypothetical protein
MPRKREYENNAIRQRAYRERQAASIGTETKNQIRQERDVLRVEVEQLRRELQAYRRLDLGAEALNGAH